MKNVLEPSPHTPLSDHFLQPGSVSQRQKEGIKESSQNRRDLNAPARKSWG